MQLGGELGIRSFIGKKDDTIHITQPCKVVRSFGIDRSKIASAMAFDFKTIFDKAHRASAAVFEHIENLALDSSDVPQKGLNITGVAK